MASQKIFKPRYIDQMISNLRSGEIEIYQTKDFIVDLADLSLTGIAIDDVPTLVIPSAGERSKRDNMENVKMIFETYKGLTRAQGSDVRIWAYLTHVNFMEYMRARTNPAEITKDASGYDYVLRHWFLEGGVARNDLSRMWWGAKLTHDETRENPYELTELFVDMQDFTRTVFGDSLSGRYKVYLEAVLEFVKEESELFSHNKQDKVRRLAEIMNAVAAYKCISVLDKQALKNMFRLYVSELSQITTT